NPLDLHARRYGYSLPPGLQRSNESAGSQLKSLTYEQKDWVCLYRVMDDGADGASTARTVRFPHWLQRQNRHGRHSSTAEFSFSKIIRPQSEIQHFHRLFRLAGITRLSG